MDNATKLKLNELITNLRVAEYMSGFASGVQLFEYQTEQTEKAKKISNDIFELIQING